MDEMDDNCKGYLDAVALALHPHKKPGDRFTYVPDQLAGMIKAKDTEITRLVELGGDIQTILTNREDELARKNQQIAALEERVEGLIAALKPIAVECHKCLRNVAAGEPFQFGIGVIEIRNAMEAVYGPSKTDAALAAPAKAGEASD